MLDLVMEYLHLKYLESEITRRRQKGFYIEHGLAGRLTPSTLSGVKHVWLIE
jgi:hypothetical protein